MPLALSARLSLKRFTKGEAAQHTHIKLNHRRIFILPSKTGLTLAIVILLMLVASINYNNSMGFVFTFLLAAAAQASTFYGFKNLSGLVVSLSKTPDYYAGSTRHLNLTVKETGERERWAIHASHLGQLKTFDLAKNQLLTIKIPIKLKHRGWYTPSTITLSTSFPFGVFRAWSPLLFKQAILVYPQAVDTGLPLDFQLSSKEQSGLQSDQLGTDDFAGLKPYQQGHNYRHINWKAFAAEKGLFSNEFNAEQSASIWLDWQSCQSLALEEKLSQLCFWVLQCESQGLEYGLRLPNIELAPSHGEAHQYACLKELALFEPI